MNNDDWGNPDDDPRGDWMSGNISRGTSGKPGSNYFTIESPTEKKYTRNWSISKDEYSDLLTDKRIYFSKKGEGVPRIKIFKNEARSVTQSSIFSDLKSSVSGKNLIIDMLGKCDFDHPKPVDLIERILTVASKKDSIILDFFAGTGTTGHAVLSLNKKDAGERTFILCTNNEENICTGICYPRIEKAIAGYVTQKKEKINGLGGNLKYFKTDFVEAESTDKNKKKLTDKATEILCLKEGTFEPVIQKNDFRVFKSNHHHTGIIFDSEVIPEFKKVIKDIKGKFHIYVFSLGDDTYEEEFEDVRQKIELFPIPESILRVYRRIFE
jgi:adenine-specific DNA-methyltransferase